jgi:hypothetical protein
MRVATFDSLQKANATLKNEATSISDKTMMCCEVTFLIEFHYSPFALLQSKRKSPKTVRCS